MEGPDVVSKAAATSGDARTAGASRQQSRGVTWRHRTVVGIEGRV